MIPLEDADREWFVKAVHELAGEDLDRESLTPGRVKTALELNAKSGRKSVINPDHVRNAWRIEQRIAGGLKPTAAIEEVAQELLNADQPRDIRSLQRDLRDYRARVRRIKNFFQRAIRRQK